jgi:hypothetical protein
VHIFCCAYDSIDRAGLQAQGTAYAKFGRDFGNPARLFNPVLWVEGKYGLIQQLRQPRYTCLPPWWALVNGRLAGSYGFGIGAATTEPTLGALGLRQYFINLFGQRNFHRGILSLA